MDRREFLKFLVLSGSLTFIGFESGCGKTSESEEIKERLAIPPTAKKVLILNQSSHWDINWQKTFNEYYKENVEKIISDSIVHLQFDRRNTYAISEIAFLERYWNDHPEKRDKLKKFFEEERLQIVGGGYTSPDTLLPTTEMLLRDWAYGNFWVLDNLGKFPDAAWQPDSFGHSGTLPDILNALGYRYVGFSRIDGAPFYVSSEMAEVMGELSGTSSFIPGSHGYYFREKGISLFWWIGPGGGRVLAYWMPFTYCQGDYIDSPIPLSLPGAIITDEDNKELVLKRIEQFLNDLAPYSQGRRYLFVPVGCDFQSPHIKLAQYAEWWNKRKFKETGTYVITATFHDFMKLSEAEEKNIPAFKADLNPLWTGFYTYHPILKESSTVITRNLIHAEVAGVMAYTQDGNSGQDRIEKLWKRGVLIDHHDWIPGTSMPHVYYDEQLPDSEKWMRESYSLWLENVERYINTAGEKETLVTMSIFPFTIRAKGEIEVEFSQPVEEAGFSESWGSGKVFATETDEEGKIKRGTLVYSSDIPPGGLRIIPLSQDLPNNAQFVVAADFGDRVEVRTAFYDPITFEKSTGDIIELSYMGKKIIYGERGNRLRIYNDDGGLYRMGMELPCGDYRELGLKPESTTFKIIDQQPLRWGFKYTAAYKSFTIEKLIYLFPDAPLIYFETDVEPAGQFPDHIAWIAAFETNLTGNTFLAHLPGGTYERKRKGIYNPTYWPIEGWLKLGSNTADIEVLFASMGNRAWRVDDDGLVELVLTRSATLEKCANLGAWCPEKYGYRSKYIFYPGEKLSDEDMIRYGFYFEVEPEKAIIGASTRGEFSLFSIDRKDILVSAFYRSTRSKGFVIRFYDPLRKGGEVNLTISLEGNFRIHRINGREEEIGIMTEGNGSFKLKLKNPIETFFLEEV